MSPSKTLRLILLSPLLLVASLVYVPVFLVCALLYLIPILRSRGRVSGTTYEPLQSRLLYDLLGTRPDPMARRLAWHLPATRLGIMTTMLAPMAWAIRLVGVTPASLRYPPPRPTPLAGMVGARCQVIDAALQEHVANGDQVVVLGAGWDPRGYDRPPDQAVPWFEVDTAGTQAVKRAAVEAAGLDASGVTFVTCDFTQQTWLEALDGQGFDRDRRTFVVWEGVSMYLDDEAVAATLRALATLPAGSRIAFDLFTRQWLDGRLGRSARRSVGWFYGEPWTWGLSVEGRLAPALERFVGEQGLAVETVWPLGNETEIASLVGAVVLAVVPER